MITNYSISCQQSKINSFLFLASQKFQSILALVKTNGFPFFLYPTPSSQNQGLLFFFLIGKRAICIKAKKGLLKLMVDRSKGYNFVRAGIPNAKM